MHTFEIIGMTLGTIVVLVLIILGCWAAAGGKFSYTESHDKPKPSLTRYQEIEIGDTVDETIEVLGTNYTRDLLANGVIRLTWKEVQGGSSYGIRGSGMRFYNPQVTKKVVVKFKDNKVIELKANNL